MPDSTTCHIANTDQQVEPHFSEVLQSRRSVIGLLGAGAAAISLGTLPSSAFFFRKPASPKLDVSKFPDRWVELQGKNLTDYADFIANLRLEKITVQQVISAHAKQKGSVWNSLPPQNMWRHIGPTLKVIDYVAKSLNTPVKEIVSVYRTPAYNARCAGARSGSWHQSNFAVDVTFPVRASVISSTARNFRNRGLFRGGVGSYPTFTHIDTRGQNIDW